MDERDPTGQRGSDLDYFQRRAEREIRSAQGASEPAVVEAHYKLAESYLERVAQLREAAGQPRKAPAEPGA